MPQRHSLRPALWVMALALVTSGCFSKETPEWLAPYSDDPPPATQSDTAGPSPEADASAPTPDTAAPAPDTSGPDTSEPDTSEPDTTEQDTTEQDTTGPDTTEQDTTCEPDCEGKVCGDDGCEGSCGSCDAGQLCDEDQSACVIDCGACPAGCDDTGACIESAIQHVQNSAASTECEQPDGSVIKGFEGIVLINPVPSGDGLLTFVDEGTGDPGSGVAVFTPGISELGWSAGDRVRFDGVHEEVMCNTQIALSQDEIATAEVLEQGLAEYGGYEVDPWLLPLDAEPWEGMPLTILLEDVEDAVIRAKVLGFKTDEVSGEAIPGLLRVDICWLDEEDPSEDLCGSGLEGFFGELIIDAKLLPPGDAANPLGVPDDQELTQLTLTQLSGILVQVSGEGSYHLMPRKPSDLEFKCTPQCDEGSCGDDGCGEPCGVCDSTEECNAEGFCEPLPLEGCSLWDPTTCPDGMRCYIKEDSLETLCMTESPTDSSANGQGCDIPVDPGGVGPCKDNAQCLLGVCSTYLCQIDGQGGGACASCGEGGFSEPFKESSLSDTGLCLNAEIPGPCNVLFEESNSCGEDEMCALTPLGSDCVEPGSTQHGDPCTLNSECAKGGVCADGLCRRLCVSAESVCGMGEIECLEMETYADLSCAARCPDTESPETINDAWGLAVCECDCTDKACGDNGCGGTCGTCADDELCTEDNQCGVPQCTPNCEGATCGDDGCGGSCGSCGLEGCDPSTSQCYQSAISAIQFSDASVTCTPPDGSEKHTIIGIVVHEPQPLFGGMLTFLDEDIGGTIFSGVAVFAPDTDTLDWHVGDRMRFTGTHHEVQCNTEIHLSATDIAEAVVLESEAGVSSYTWGTHLFANQTLSDDDVEGMHITLVNGDGGQPVAHAVELISPQPDTGDLLRVNLCVDHVCDTEVFVDAMLLQPDQPGEAPILPLTDGQAIENTTLNALSGFVYQVGDHYHILPTPQSTIQFGCEPLCHENACGSDGCGGSCGECGVEGCNEATGQCYSSAIVEVQESEASLSCQSELITEEHKTFIGIVTAPPLAIDGGSLTFVREWDSGLYAGIAVFANTPNLTWQLGDLVRFSGQHHEEQCNTEVMLSADDVEAAVVLDSGLMAEPIDLSTETFAQDMEAYEGQPISLTNGDLPLALVNERLVTETGELLRANLCDAEFHHCEVEVFIDTMLFGSTSFDLDEDWPIDQVFIHTLSGIVYQFGPQYHILPQSSSPPVTGCLASCQEGANGACGDDGCGGTCGACAPDFICSDGLCVEECVPLTCDYVTCGNYEDGCGGVLTCGQCEPWEVCDNGSCAAQSCTCLDQECAENAAAEGACPEGSVCTLVSEADCSQYDADCGGLDNCFVWSYADGGNGHAYALVMAESDTEFTDWTTWIGAKSAAEGFGGESATYLMTLQGILEFEWVQGTFQPLVEGNSLFDWGGAWLGGWQPDILSGSETEDDPAEGWAWVSGEFWDTHDYAAYWVGGEPPNNADGNEHCLQFYFDTFEWNDNQCDSTLSPGYFIEIESLNEGCGQSGDALQCRPKAGVTQPANQPCGEGDQCEAPTQCVEGLCRYLCQNGTDYNAAPCTGCQGEATIVSPALGLGVCGTCQPSCDGKSCGDDGCGGTCGACSGGTACQDGVCQDVCQGSDERTTQSEVDALSECISYTGDLRIVGPAISSVAALSQLNYIGGSLVIDGISAQKVELDTLELIAGDLEVSGISDLLSLSFKNLTQVQGSFAIEENGSLQSLEGFSQLSVVAGEVKVASNPDLIGIGGVQLGTNPRPVSVGIVNNASLCEVTLQSEAQTKFSCPSTADCDLLIYANFNPCAGATCGFNCDGETICTEAVSVDCPSGESCVDNQCLKATPDDCAAADASPFPLPAWGSSPVELSYELDGASAEGLSSTINPKDETNVCSTSWPYFDDGVSAGGGEAGGVAPWPEAIFAFMPSTAATYRFSIESNEGNAVDFTPTVWITQSGQVGTPCEETLATPLPFNDPHAPICKGYGAVNGLERRLVRDLPLEADRRVYVVVNVPNGTKGQVTMRVTSCGDGPCDPICGNGIIEGEACDDGNTLSDDTCNADCSEARFVDNGDGTVTDLGPSYVEGEGQGLMWTKCSQAATGNAWSEGSKACSKDPAQFTYCQGTGCGTYDASEAPDPSAFQSSPLYQSCQTLNEQQFAGHSDWRVPSAHELKSLVFCSGVREDDDKWPSSHGPCSPPSIGAQSPFQMPAIDLSVFPDTVGANYWSATPGENAFEAHSVGFAGGGENTLSKGATRYVRCVRNAEAAPPAALGKDCRDVLENQPDAQSGVYAIDPDGPGGEDPVQAYCDMETEGGGWTRIFISEDPNYYDLHLNYTLDVPSLRTPDSLVMVGYMPQAGGAISNRATFLMPDSVWWLDLFPLQAGAEDKEISVSVNGQAPVTATLRYGYQSAPLTCGNNWGTSNYGRFCITGTEAPYFGGFADDALDYCVASNETYPQNHNSEKDCDENRRFAIFVRRPHLSDNGDGTISDQQGPHHTKTWLQCTMPPLNSFGNLTNANASALGAGMPNCPGHGAFKYCNAAANVCNGDPTDSQEEEFDTAELDNALGQDDAFNVCEALNTYNSGLGFSGRSHWRVPNLGELSALVPIDTSLFHLEVINESGNGNGSNPVYWSSTSKTLTEANALNMENGEVSYVFKSNTRLIRCVHDGE